MKLQNCIRRENTKTINKAKLTVQIQSQNTLPVNLPLKYLLRYSSAFLPSKSQSQKPNPMSSKHTHCYSNYVNNILNNSPTKITYTFPKGQRFSPSNISPKTPIDQIIQKAFPCPTKKIPPQTSKQFLTSSKKLINNFIQKDKQSLFRYPATAGHANRKDQISRSRSISHDKIIYPFEKYLNNEILRNSNNGKKFQRSKSTKAVRFAQNNFKAPKAFNTNKSADKKKKVWEKNDPPQKQQKKISFQRVQTAQSMKKDIYGSLQFPQSLGANKYLKYSPYYLQLMKENGEQNQISRQKKFLWQRESSKSKQKKRHSRIKTSTTVLQEMDHPSKHITVQGYYPLGTQINPNGKYVPSTYKNVPAHSFGKSPTKNDKKNKKTSITLEKNKSLMPNGAEMYPETSFYYKNLTQKKISQQIKKLEQRYVPFSQFGNTTGYRY